MRREFRQPDLPVGKVAAPVVVDYWPPSPPRTHASHSRNSDSGLDTIRDSRIASSFRQWLSGHDLITPGVSGRPLSLSRSGCGRGVRFQALLPGSGVTARLIGERFRAVVRLRPDAGQLDGFVRSARRRIPTFGDASRAVRIRLSGPSRLDDEVCRGS